jgi:hypothetical protein
VHAEALAQASAAPASVVEVHAPLVQTAFAPHDVPSPT